MDRKFVQLANELSLADSSSMLLAALARAADSLGATTFSADVLTSAVSGRGRVVEVANQLPERYLLDSFRTVSQAQIDPVMQHLRTQSSPVWWNRDTYSKRSREVLKKWEYMEAYGLAAGVGVARHVHAARHYALGFEWRTNAPATPEAIGLATTALTMFAALSEPAAYRIASEALGLRTTGDVDLTDREIACLYWASRGKPDVVTARFLCLSPRTVNKYIDSAREKLQASNRTQAAVRAAELGLLHEPPVSGMPGKRP